jgi:hypothetical protein
MVRGLERFLNFFDDWKSSFAIIGGCACAQWCEDSAVRFRSTQDIDMVLLLEAKAPGFFARFWEYVRKGQYVLERRADDNSTILFRFERPGAGADFPKRIELLTGIMDLGIPKDIRIAHLDAEDGRYSLSAILLQEEYYNLVANGCAETKNGMPAVMPDILALLKAKAYLNLLKDKAAGRFVPEHDLKKHRNDVFQLAYLFRGRYASELAELVKNDMAEFLRLHSESNDEWNEIQAHLKAFGMEVRAPSELLRLIRDYFGI